MPGSSLIIRRLMRWRRAGAWWLIVLSMVVASGLLRTEFDSSINVLLGQSDPYLQERDQLREIFPAPTEVSFIFHDPASDAFSERNLSALAELQRSYRSIPGAVRIASLLNYHSPTGEVSIVPFPWQNLTRFSNEEVDAMRQRALDDPLINGVLISGDAKLAIAQITLAPANASSGGNNNRAINAAVTDLLASLRAAHPQVDIHANAEALFEQSTRAAMISDLLRLLPLVIAVCVLLICYCFRSWALGFSVLLVAALTVTLTIGTVAWLGQPFNVISIMAPLVVVIIAVADAVHIISVFRQQLARGDGVLAAMQHSLDFNLRPITLATMTTAIGFASLNLVSAPALSNFGSIVAIGVLYAWLVTLLLLPATVVWIARHWPAAACAADTRLTGGITRACQRLGQRYRQRIFVGGIMLGLLGLLLLPLNEIDFDRMDFIPADSPLHDYYTLLSRHTDAGPLLTYGISSGQAEGAIEPAFLLAVDEFARWLREQEGVLGAVSLVEVVSTIHQSLTAADYDSTEAAHRIPDQAATVRQHLADYQLVQTERYALGNFVSADLAIIQLFVSTSRLSNRQLVELDQHLSGGFDTMLPAAELLHGSGTLLFARMDQNVTLELLQGYALSLLMITLTLILGFRSWRLGLLSVIPNVMPAVIVFGAWALIDGQLDPFVLMLFSVSIGLVVDDTVHILSTFQRQRLQGVIMGRALTQAVTKAGPALIITTAVLALGTLILIAAQTLYFQQAARLLVPIVVLALILDLLWLPTLLRRLHSLRGRLRRFSRSQ